MSGIAHIRRMHNIIMLHIFLRESDLLAVYWIYLQKGVSLVKLLIYENVFAKQVVRLKSDEHFRTLKVLYGSNFYFICHLILTIFSSGLLTR